MSQENESALHIECRLFQPVFGATAARDETVHTAEAHLLVREGDPFVVLGIKSNNSAYYVQLPPPSPPLPVWLPFDAVRIHPSDTVPGTNLARGDGKLQAWRNPCDGSAGGGTCSHLLTPAGAPPPPTTGNPRLTSPLGRPPPILYLQSRGPRPSLEFLSFQKDRFPSNTIANYKVSVDRLLAILENQRDERGGTITFTEAAYNAARATVAREDHTNWRVWVDNKIKIKFQTLLSECAVGATQPEFAQMLLDLAGLEIGGQSSGIRPHLVKVPQLPFSIVQLAQAHMFDPAVSLFVSPQSLPQTPQASQDELTSSFMDWSSTPGKSTNGSPLVHPYSAQTDFSSTFMASPPPHFQAQAPSAEGGDFMSYGLDPLDFASGDFPMDFVASILSCDSPPLPGSDDFDVLIESLLYNDISSMLSPVISQSSPVISNQAPVSNTPIAPNVDNIFGYGPGPAISSAYPPLSPFSPSSSSAPLNPGQFPTTSTKYPLQHSMFSEAQRKGLATSAGLVSARRPALGAAPKPAGVPVPAARPLVAGPTAAVRPSSVFKRAPSASTGFDRRDNVPLRGDAEKQPQTGTVAPTPGQNAAAAAARRAA
ncbi:hypothetical protein BDK51DRAFT_43502, partial [Blyttiomyces helicus]